MPLEGLTEIGTIISCPNMEAIYKYVCTSIFVWNTKYLTGFTHRIYFST